MNSIMNAGLHGMLQSQASMVQNANAIARANVKESVINSENVNLAGGETQLLSPSSEERAVDPTEAFINLRRDALVFDASAKVMKTADRALGSLINDYS